MTKSKTISISILVVAVAVVLYFAFGVARKRYFSPNENGKLNISEDQGQNGNSVENSSGDQAIEENQTMDSQEPSDAQKAEAEGAHLYVVPEDCDKNCEKFKDNADDLKYCQEVCGIIPAQKKESKEECGSLSGLEKDYCLRDAAVTKKDADICDEIRDSKVRRTCLSRVAEELLN